MADPEPSETNVDDEFVERHLGRYRIQRPIASGGMASVHLASVDGKEGFSKLVALKVIHDHLVEDAAFVEMFLDEARIAARIEHVNVCTVFDFGECDGSYFIAMEYLAGQPLSGVRDAVRKRAYPAEWPAMAASMFVQACEGLHAAHNLVDGLGAPVGLVHRDISPQNLFVTYSGTVKVVDFGIARASGRSYQTVPGTLKGKFAYLAPEQLADADNVDRRVDIWALGVTLWELLTLRPLFRRANHAETLSAVLHHAIPLPSELKPLVPPELDAIVMRALARDPATRYASARELGRDLAAFCRARGALAGTGEIEEWLETLMPGAREESLRSASVTPAVSQTRVRSETGARKRAAEESARAPTTPVASVEEPRAASGSDRDRVRSIVATGTLLLVGIAVGILAAMSQPDAPASHDAVDRAPTTSSSR